MTYVIPTDVPAELKPETDRMLGIMIPQPEQTWFFKVTGPESAVDSIATKFREFVENVPFEDGKPVLAKLPEGWQLAGGNKPFRFASINIETAQKQLDLSVSNLARQEDWDSEVLANVNRWRGQLGLAESKDQWAGAEAVKVKATDDDAIWVDLVGDASSSSAAPMMASTMGDQTNSDQAPSPSVNAEKTPPGESPQSRFKSEMPAGWRVGKESSMRWASFSAGPEDAPVDISVIPAGGDTRGNIDRWIRQIRTEVTDEMVDEAIKSAEEIKVGGRDAQRFILKGDEKNEEAADDQTLGQTIDATIVPLEDDFSLFIKMTGSADAVAQQHDALTSYLQSIEL